MKYTGRRLKDIIWSIGAIEGLLQNAGFGKVDNQFGGKTDISKVAYDSDEDYIQVEFRATSGMHDRENDIIVKPNANGVAIVAAAIKRLEADEKFWAYLFGD